MSYIADAKVAKRYAGALFSAARRAGTLDAVQHDLDMLVSLWTQVPNLQRAMESPLLPDEKKNSLLDQMFGNEVNPMTRAFLRLLVEKGREHILMTVQAEFHRLADAARGLLRASAVVALPLDDSERAALVTGLQRRTGKQIELEVRVDPAILGGVVVRMQDAVIDGSVRGALERLREQMLRER